MISETQCTCLELPLIYCSSSEVLSELSNCFLSIHSGQFTGSSTKLLWSPQIKMYFQSRSTGTKKIYQNTALTIYRCSARKMLNRSGMHEVMHHVKQSSHDSRLQENINGNKEQMWEEEKNSGRKSSSKQGKPNI